MSDKWPDSTPMSGEHFREMRKACGLKSYEMARWIGVTPETTSKWETGKLAVPVYAKRLISYAVRYGVEPRRSSEGAL